MYSAVLAGNAQFALASRFGFRTLLQMLAVSPGIFRQLAWASLADFAVVLQAAAQSCSYAALFTPVLCQFCQCLPRVFPVYSPSHPEVLLKVPPMSWQSVKRHAK